MIPTVKAFNARKFLQGWLKLVYLEHEVFLARKSTAADQKDFVCTMYYLPVTLIYNYHGRFLFMLCVFIFMERSRY